MTTNKYYPVSWKRYHELTLKLASTILSLYDIKFDEIVAISRGGLTFGHILTDFLDLPICSFTIQSYTDIQKQGEVEITEPLSKPIEGKKILVVDDVADSGKTLTRAISYLKQFNPKSLTLITMFYKPSSIIKPDFYAIKTSKWIIFPTEVSESIKSITIKMEKEGKTKKEIQSLLMSLGYSINQISFVRKYHLTFKP